MAIFERLSAIPALLVLAGLGIAQTPVSPPSSAPPVATAAPAAITSKPASREDYDPLFDPPPLPHTQITLLGGTVTSVDDVQNHITVKPFGGKQKLHLDFDTRTHIFRDGQEATERELHAGQRVYLDTMLNGSRVFAKSIWIRTNAGSGNGRGQILRYDSRSNTLTLRDEVSAQPVNFRLDSATVIHNGTASGSVADLKSGSLVAVSFGPGNGRSGVVRELSLLAIPGSSFTFLGKITFIDISRKMISVANQSDDKNYDIYFESIPATVLQRLREGSQASISAIFDGERYVAQKIDLASGEPQGTGDSQPQ